MKKNEKKLSILFGVLALVLLTQVFYIIDLSFNKSQQRRLEKYNALLEGFSNKTISGKETPSGPDKANFRDFMMTVDVDKGFIPKERLYKLKKELQNNKRRKGDLRDFGWFNLNSNVAGRSRSFIINPSTGKLLAGFVTGGLWQNDDYTSNANWSPVEGFENTSISCIINDPQNSNILYMGSGESQTAMLNYRESSSVGNGIWKSSDGGENWEILESTDGFQYINDIIVRIEDGQSVLYAAVASGEYKSAIFYSQPGDGLYRSEDGGNSWDQVLPNIPGETESYAVSDIELTSDNTIYVGTMRNLENKGGGAVLKSTNGIDWSINEPYLEDVAEISNQYGGATVYPGRVVLKSSSSNPNRIYAVFMSGLFNSYNQLRDYFPEIKQSFDAGSNWSSIPQPENWSNIPWHAASLAVDPSNENKLIIGALDMFVLPDASNSANSDLSWIKLTNWAAMYSASNPSLTQEQKDSLSNHYVHGDIHMMEFINGSSDEILVTTDGGMFYSNNMSNTNEFDPETNPESYPTFHTINNSLTTTQYYSAAITPTKGQYDAIGGTQDNGSIYNFGNGTSDIEQMVSGGDGGPVFWDQDDPDLYITTVYGNMFFIHYKGNTTQRQILSGLFINPSDYDSETNLIYTNLASGPQGGLYNQIRNRYLDSLLIVNVNNIVSNNSNGLPNMKIIKLNSGSTEPFTAVKLSPRKGPNGATLFLGTHFGKMYKVTGLPNNPVTTRIDGNSLPLGYISSIDVGENDNSLLVTLSNYGVKSVYVTRNGGFAWKNIERDLPDIPVRWGMFSPFSHDQVILATELGVWGLESIANEEATWQDYNQGLPKIRVDMVSVRKEDSTIVAATHGRGIWIGKLEMGESFVTTSLDEDKFKSELLVYPNPARDFLYFKSDDKLKYDLHHISLININGQEVINENIRDKEKITLAKVENGFYLINGRDRNGKIVFRKKIIIEK